MAEPLPVNTAWLASLAEAGYKIQQLIGQGGMASVYLAEDTRLERQVAIKLVEFGDHDPAEGLQEARLLARLNNPHIVQIHDVLAKDNCLALVMEYLKGQTLQQFHLEHVASLTQKLQWLYEISDGLAAAHHVGIVHCDLKLGNIVLSDKSSDTNRDINCDINSAKIIDFGISQAESVLGHSDSTHSQGTQITMSPEQLQFQPIDHRSDLFSLGILAWQLIAGEHPFGTGSAQQMARRMVDTAPMDAAHISPQLPTALVDLLNQLLQKSPQLRPDSTANVAQRFRQILIGLTQQEILDQQTVATEPLVSNAAEKTALRPRVTTRLSILALLLVMVIVGVAFVVDYSAEMPLRQIVVLRPDLKENSDTRQQDLVANVVDDAIRQSIVNTPGMHLISQREVAAISAGIKAIGIATGATDIITTELDCNNSRCNVTFSRLSGADWVVQNRQYWPTPIENMLNLYGLTQTHFAKLYPEWAVADTKLQNVNEQDYLSYIELYQQVRTKAQSSEAVLSELKQVLVRSPYLFAGYGLFRETARKLHAQTKDSTYPAQVQALLQSAPPEYRYSVFQAVDLFWLAVDSGELEQAKNQLAVATQRGLDSSSLIELQAYWFQVSNQFADSIASYQQALKLRPSVTSRYNLALSYWWNSDLTQAKQQLLQVLAITADYKYATQLLASIYLLQGDVSSAVTSYQEIVAKNPQSIDLSNLSLAYALLGEDQKALKFATMAVEKSPGHPTWLLNLADAQAISGLTQQAQKNYQQVISLHQGKADLKSWLERAQAYVHTGADEAAVKALNAARKLAPQNGEVAFTGALVYTQLNEDMSAVTQVEEALNNGIGVIWFNLPWFDRLCDTPQFNRIMLTESNLQRCGD